ncbi:hypothetical protein HRbin19_01187 [bacterium HR19]|nr:hypothetical protein HRbin19_01187 [bacterium HR19]
MNLFFISTIYGSCSKPSLILDELENLKGKLGYQIYALFVVDGKLNEDIVEHISNYRGGIDVFVIENRKRLGQHRSIFEGIDFIVNRKMGINLPADFPSSSDIFFILDGDMFEYIRYSQIFIKYLSKFDVVIGVILNKRYPALRQILTHVFYVMLFSFSIFSPQKMKRIYCFLQKSGIDVSIYKFIRSRRTLHFSVFSSFKGSVLYRLPKTNNYLISLLSQQERLEIGFVFLPPQNFSCGSSYSFYELFKLSLLTLKDVFRYFL